MLIILQLATNLMMLHVHFRIIGDHVQTAVDPIMMMENKESKRKESLKVFL
ncbi:hypothetical protein IOC57_02665 [Bacillus sp. SD075]|uniref:hypothetical protein n=1 Tax=Bacillus sp. SD075 TaxID=2781732 RepID=UPI001A95D852|nr:hypothetical protein [Bacillus sp. SD075]MBO0996670.1 hypothetical protein [Bacillus sp. SD075]